MTFISDFVIAHKYLHKAINYSPSDVGLVFTSGNSRTASVRMVQHHVPAKTCGNYYASKIQHEWNALPQIITEITSLRTFKAKLRRYLFINQES